MNAENAVFNQSRKMGRTPETKEGPAAEKSRGALLALQGQTRLSSSAVQAAEFSRSNKMRHSPVTMKGPPVSREEGSGLPGQAKQSCAPVPPSSSVVPEHSRLQAAEADSAATRQRVDKQELELAQLRDKILELERAAGLCAVDVEEAEGTGGGTTVDDSKLKTSTASERVSIVAGRSEAVGETEEKENILVDMVKCLKDEVAFLHRHNAQLSNTVKIQTDELATLDAKLTALIGRLRGC